MSLVHHRKPQKICCFATECETLGMKHILVQGKNHSVCDHLELTGADWLRLTEFMERYKQRLPGPEDLYAVIEIFVPSVRIADIEAGEILRDIDALGPHVAACCHAHASIIKRLAA